MPDDAVYAAYTAYKFKFKDVPSDYSEIYAYTNNLKEIKRRFPEKNNAPNLFILKKDANLDNYGKTSTIGNIFVDLWNLEEWYAKEFLNAIEKRLS